MMSLEAFFDTPSWGSVIEREVRNRIKLSVAAYAYEVESTTVMSDAEFDKLSYEIDLTVSTGNTEMDEFFQSNFDASTGQWIHKHPRLSQISELFFKYYQNNS